jgi:hypothetical protein
MKLELIGEGIIAKLRIPPVKAVLFGLGFSVKSWVILGLAYDEDAG